MIRSHEDRPLLEEELYENISIHYGGRSGHLDGSLEELSRARESSRTSNLLLVPPKYKRAYRMMTNIHPTFLAKFARKDASVLGDSGSIRGGVYCPHVGLGTLMVSSWTVDPPHVSI